MDNQFRLTFEEFAVLFEPTHGWADDATVRTDYEQFLVAIRGLRKEDVLTRILYQDRVPSAH
jgi:hypothetical protein